MSAIERNGARALVCCLLIVCREISTLGVTDEWLINLYDILSPNCSATLLHGCVRAFVTSTRRVRELKGSVYIMQSAAACNNTGQQNMALEIDHYSLHSSGAALSVTLAAFCWFRMGLVCVRTAYKQAGVSQLLNWFWSVISHTHTPTLHRDK